MACTIACRSLTLDSAGSRVCISSAVRLITGDDATLIPFTDCIGLTSVYERSWMISISPRSRAAFAVASSGTMMKRTSSTSGRFDPVKPSSLPSWFAVARILHQADVLAALPFLQHEGACPDRLVPRAVGVQRKSRCTTPLPAQ